jgi:hypothetical protein
MSLCIIVIVWWKEFVEVQVVESQLTDSDSSSGNKLDKSPPKD